MNTAQTIATALLDSSAEEFMKSYTKERPARWEFTQDPYSSNVWEVKRWNFQGSYNYIGSVSQDGPKWQVHTVATGRFHYRGGPEKFSTKEEAAERLWELSKQS